MAPSRIHLQSHLGTPFLQCTEGSHRFGFALQHNVIVQTAQGASMWWLTKCSSGMEHQREH